MSEVQTDSFSFQNMGLSYQEKLVQALVEDGMFADQMSEVLEPTFLSFDHLELIVRTIFDYVKRYRAHPSPDVLACLVRDSGQTKRDEVVTGTALAYLGKLRDNPLNGDRQYIMESSLDFCRKQSVVRAMVKVIDKAQVSKFDDIASIMKDALSKGAARDAGHEYTEDFERRVSAETGARISTGWGPLDRVLGGGYKRKTLVTFIAPTGAGKSMFLVNVACAAVQQGYNVLYATLELSEADIGLRADAYFSEVAIDDVSKTENRPRVKKAIADKVKGRLFIKEWPVGRASVETVRNHIEKLKQTKGFYPDVVIIDYADLLRSSSHYGEKRHELKENYEDLRGLGQELDVTVVTADQTNRGGLDQELVTIAAISEAYGKAQVCDLILTVSRTIDDKQNDGGRIFNAKSRLGKDGQIFPFTLNTAFVRATLHEPDYAVGLPKAAPDSEKMRRVIRDALDRKVSGDQSEPTNDVRRAS